jgi:hypothetical protein
LGEKRLGKTDDREGGKIFFAVFFSQKFTKCPIQNMNAIARMCRTHQRGLNNRNLNMFCSFKNIIPCRGVS